MSLLTLQRDFRTWLTTEAPEAGARIAPGAASGLSIYLNNYRASLMACLADSFGATRAWLGEEAFAAAAANHIDRLPPHSWTLDAYALDFPATLALRYPEDAEVAELARIELALGLAFVGPDAAPLDPASLNAVDWDAAALHFVRTLTAMTLTSNAAAIWSAITAEQTPPAAAMLPMPATLIIWRDGLTPCFQTLDAEEAEWLALMIAGNSFGDLCARIVERHGEEQGPAMAGALLGQWLRGGLVAGVGAVEQS